ncbi:MAG: DoxX family protein [Pirellulales bacterium]
MTSLKITAWALRIALAATFLSAVADRLGLWGPPGTPGVAWGDVAQYEAYVAVLNGFLPSSWIPIVGWTATGAEIVLAFGLLIGVGLRWFAWASAALLSTFAITMVVALGPKPPLDYSVFTAASAAALLAAVETARAGSGVERDV